MGILYTEKENIILPKEVTLVPYSNEVDYITFSKLWQLHIKCTGFLEL